MKYILKTPSPPAFETWKNRRRPTRWDLLKGNRKRQLREALLIEQGHLCCYCQQRIENEEKTVIEHFYPRNGANKAVGLAKMFDYDNLHVACDGGAHDNEERNKQSLALASYPLYCEKHKDKHLLPLSPLEPTVETRFKYVDVGLNELSIYPNEVTDQDATIVFKPDQPKSTRPDCQLGITYSQATANAS